ncbi:MAG: hypothetical protein LBK64_02585, partial [Spirochaetaceae bacterium]|nr:hypothetical protein [Spirochaetaceae bacterium]
YKSEGGGVRVSNDESEFTLKGGTISGNIVISDNYAVGGGVMVYKGTFTMEGGRIQGSEDSDGVTKNTATRDDGGAALFVNQGQAVWGTGGTYTQGGVDKTGGSDIGSTDDMLIAVPAP